MVKHRNLKRKEDISKASKKVGCWWKAVYSNESILVKEKEELSHTRKRCGSLCRAAGNTRLAWLERMGAPNLNWGYNFWAVSWNDYLLSPSSFVQNSSLLFNSILCLFLKTNLTSRYVTFTYTLYLNRLELCKAKSRHTFVFRWKKRCRFFQQSVLVFAVTCQFIIFIGSCMESRHLIYYSSSKLFCSVINAGSLCLQKQKSVGMI